MFRNAIARTSAPRNAFTRGARRQISLQERSRGGEGQYKNLPFSVHNRRVPYWVLHWGFFTLGLGAPFAITWLYLKKTGSL